MSIKHTVIFDEYTQRHYIKKFVKRHSQKVWDVTEIAMRNICMKAETALQTDQLRIIHTHENISVCKYYFTVAGTNLSYKHSCCRCILTIDDITKKVVVLLVYHKKDLSGKGGETVQWERIIKENFPEYKEMIS